MSVIALVCEEEEARRVVTWAGRFAAAEKSELIVFFLVTPQNGGQLPHLASTEEGLVDPVLEAVNEAIEMIVRTRRARVGRIPRHAVSVRHIHDTDPLQTTISRIQVEDPRLIVAAGKTPDAEPKGKTLAQRVVAGAPCDCVMLYGDASRSTKASQILVATTEGRHDASAIQLAADTAACVNGVATILQVEASVGSQAIEVGERALRAGLRELQLEESKNLQVKAVAGDDRDEKIANEIGETDLVFIGANGENAVPRLLESATHPQIAVFRQAPHFAFGRRKLFEFSWLPRLNPADYTDLYEKLQSGSRWNTDFVLMLGLAAAIATLGLLQSSPAVVIGSMLLAPWMTPMIGMGLALNQGNPRLAYACFRSIGRGFLTALVISIFIGYITPGSDLTPEVIARTAPNILDLLIAFFSGIAAAYALARPGISGSIAGVAIATALVPPLCAVGISLAYHQLPEALGAASLLFANVVSIILAAAMTFRAMGLRVVAELGERERWVRQVIAGLAVAALCISIPLGSAFIYQVHQGKATPIALSVTNETRAAILQRIQEEQGVTLLLIGRPGIPRESDPVDVGIVIASERRLPKSFADELAEIVRTQMQTPELRVKVACVADGWDMEGVELGPNGTE